jgi:hypothetical protein
MSVLITSSLDKSIISVHPFNEEIINIIQEFKNRKYNNKTKEFTMLSQDMESFKNKLNAQGFTWTDNKENLISNNNDNNAKSSGKYVMEYQSSDEKNDSEKENDKDDLKNSIILKYEKNHFYIQNSRIENKFLYYEIKKLHELYIFKKKERIYFSESLFLFFLELCNKYESKIKLI